MVMLLVNSRFLPQNMVHGPVASAIPRCLIEIQYFQTPLDLQKKNLHMNKTSGISINTLV